MSNTEHKAKIYYHRLDDFWLKEKKYWFLYTSKSYLGIPWQELVPTEDHTWLTEGFREDFETFIQIQNFGKYNRIEFSEFSLSSFLLFYFPANYFYSEKKIA